MANENGWMRSLAYFVRMKALYKNCTVYSYSNRKVADLIKCSATTLGEHLKILTKLGLVRCHNDNITFLGFHKLKEWSGGGNQTAAINVDDKNQLTLLRLPIINTCLRQQEYKIRKRGIKLYETTDGMNILPKNSIEIASSYAGCSCIRVGILFKGKCKNGRMSKMSGSRLVQKLRELGKIKATKIFARLYSGVLKVDYEHLKAQSLIPAHSFYYKGSIIVPKRTKLVYTGN